METARLSPTNESAAYRRADVARAVADLIRSDIHSGHYSETLSYEWDLLKRYDVSRSVLRDALGIAQAQGLIDRVRGMGTFTRDATSAFKMQRTEEPIYLNSDDETMTKMVTTESVTSRLVAHFRAKASAPVAANLGLPLGAPVVYAENLFYVDSVPQRLRASWIAAERVPGLEEQHLDGHVSRVIESITGELPVIDRILIEAIVADESTGELLGTPPAAPILFFEFVNKSSAGELLEYGFTKNRGTVIDSRVA